MAVVGLMCILVSLATSCKDDDADTSAVPFDPSQPVVITSFTPEGGGSQDQIIIKGKNFGIDKTKVKLTIGGKDAVVVNVMSDKLYGIVPQRAFTGEIALTVFDEGGTPHTAVAEKHFAY